MPVTKKKGAIFAVYADTPPRSLASSSSSTSSTTSKRSSPSKATRRALAQLPPAAAKAALKPKALGAVGGIDAPAKDPNALIKKPGVLGAKPVAKPLGARPLSGKPLASKGKVPLREPLRASSGSLAPQRRLGAVPASNAAKPLRAGGGRTFQIFTDEPAPPAAAPTAPTSANLPSALAAKASRPLEVEDKENGAPRPALATKSVRAPLGGVSKKIATKRPLQQRTVSVLLDASEAYGASREEPAGFRDVFVSPGWLLDLRGSCANEARHWHRSCNRVHRTTEGGRERTRADTNKV